MHIPNHPKDFEKYQYITHRQVILTIFSILGFAGVVYSSTRFFTLEPALYIFLPFLLLLIVTFLISLWANGISRPFDAHAHSELIDTWNPKRKPSVDIFLPVCGEDLRILRNTWHGVQFILNHYGGNVTVYVLDDGDDKHTKDAASEFGFTYLVRDNRGHFKKAGNLQHGFQNSKSEFIAIFDADFKPRADFFDELLPYFDEDPTLGIVQSPQYFDVLKKQNWVERGAGAVQEYFYRSIQQNRQALNGAICVGSNAIYRRKALNSNGGTTLIEHSEDVHTGFDLRRNGWGLKYIPVVLAKGVCPDDLRGFFRQQYRWCMGSMSLLSSEKFWGTRMSLSARMCYLSGFLYYIQTAVMSIILPLIPLALLFIVPHQAQLLNYIPLVPALVYNLFIFPIWHRTRYSTEVISTRNVYGWAHLFAIVDSLGGSRQMEWNPSGSIHQRTSQYTIFKYAALFYGFGLGLTWVGMSIYYMIAWNFLNFLPVFLTGFVYLLSNIRIVRTAFAHERKNTPAESGEPALTSA